MQLSLIALALAATASLAVPIALADMEVRNPDVLATPMSVREVAATAETAMHALHPQH